MHGGTSDPPGPTLVRHAAILNYQAYALITDLTPSALMSTTVKQVFF